MAPQNPGRCRRRKHYDILASFADGREVIIRQCKKLDEIAILMAHYSKMDLYPGRDYLLNTREVIEIIPR